MSVADIAIRNARKVYPGGVEAVAGIDFTIAAGELCVLVGPSGCGKSTLLRMIAGLETITEGEIAVGGTVVNGLEPAERDIAMVFQNYALYPHMSVYDNMAYGLKNRGTPRAEIEERVAEAARILAIEPFLKRKPRQLSGGQRQRVAMGRAIVRQPRAFLFDEPLSNLDAKLRTQTRVEIKRLQQRMATTSVYVTHDQLEAMTLADKLVVMNAGRVEQIGTPVEVYDRPETTFVAGFIGAPPMNFLPVSVASADGSLTLRDGRTIGTAGATPWRNGEGILGIRPEDAWIVPAGEPVGEDRVGLPLTVTIAEVVGSDTFVHGRVGEAPAGEAAAIMDADMIVRAPGKAALAPGETVEVVFPRDRLHRFDPASGRRID
jgi:sn-glycerol 3-phosphate transport system ATP-binding protein